MNILLTSVGRRTYMIKFFKDALGVGGKVYASNSVLTYTMLQADGYFITPYIYDSSYIDTLLEICKKHNITSIISLFDIDLPVLAANKFRFNDAGIDVVVSEYNVTQICNDKWKTYQFLKNHGFRQAFSSLSYLDVLEAVRNGVVTYPIIVKPRWGMGSIGVYTAYTDEELKVLSQKLSREVFDTYLRFESNQDPDLCVIFQEKIHGLEYGMEVLNDLSGNFVKSFVKRKLSMRAGETDIAETVESVSISEVGKIVSGYLHHYGVLDVDLFVTDAGEIVILEMNCRFGGQYPFTHNAGVNIPRQLIKWLSGDTTDWNLLNMRSGVVSSKEIECKVF